MRNIPVFGVEAAIPPTCGGLSFCGMEFYGESDHDASFRYTGPGFIRADAYLIKEDGEDITGDLQSPVVIQLFQNACEALFMAAEAGIYLDLETLVSREICLPHEPATPFCLWGAFAYRQAPGPDVIFTERQISHLSMRIDRGYINKVRYTYPDGEMMAKEGCAFFMAFIEEWTAAIRSCGTQAVKSAHGDGFSKEGKQKKEREGNWAGLVEARQNSAERRRKWLQGRYERRLSELNDLLTAMKGAPEFEDVEAVVSQEHFDDMVRALAMYHVSEHGGDIEETTRQLESEIWNLSNPYMYMYEMIKKYGSSLFHVGNLKLSLPPMR